MKTGRELGSTNHRNYMSIGDVIKSLSDEFPDVSMSKIRFLEAEGLIEPERTPSGYRRFYQEDLARLKYILRLQRDHFVPLKVIRKRLEHFDASEVTDEPAAPAAVPPPSARLVREESELGVIDGGVQMSLAELLNATGLAEDEIRELEDYGLIHSHPLPSGGVYYDEDDLTIAKLAKDFGKYGIGARHLKMFKNFADKEAVLFEQVVIPLVRAGGIEGRRTVTQSLNELAKLARRLKQVLLRSSLQKYLQA
ncbi:MAG: MerR family transcriptional regulator [Actinomycetota bacterium]|nr:MerR family transcriptional regulator [Actinomycetota bacterium]